MKTYLYIIGLAIGIIGSMPVAEAIPPPDFLFNIGGQIAQVFAVIVLFLSALIASIRQFAGTYFRSIKKRTWLWVVLAVFVIVGAFAAAAWYSQGQEKKIYNNWVSEQKSSKSLPEAVIKNDEFASLMNEGEIFILDAREDEEYEIGNLPGSKHVRFADLIDGEWKDLPKNEEVYVLCWSGIRGAEVTEFLRSKGVKARYLEDGASGWVEYGGKWDGEIKFSEVYGESRYNGFIGLGAIGDSVVIDVREEETYLSDGFESDFQISTFNTPSDQLVKDLAGVPANSKVATVCDDWVNCFDAKITGIKLEKLGHTFIGRYEK